MDNPYSPPATPLPDPSAAAPGPTVGPERSGRHHALFLTITALLVGTVLAQAASLAAAWLFGSAQIPEQARGAVGLWCLVNVVATVCGTAGIYRTIRRDSVAWLPLLLFLVIFTATFRFDGVAPGWPFQLHLGMNMGRVGVGINLIGVALLVGWFRLRAAEAARIAADDAPTHAGRTSPVPDQPDPAPASAPAP